MCSNTKLKKNQKKNQKKSSKMESAIHLLRIKFFSCCLVLYAIRFICVVSISFLCGFFFTSVIVIAKVYIAWCPFITGLIFRHFILWICNLMIQTKPISHGKNHRIIFLLHIHVFWEIRLYFFFIWIYYVLQINCIVAIRCDCFDMIGLQ